MNSTHVFLFPAPFVLFTSVLLGLLSPQALWAQATLENPQPGSAQSSALSLFLSIRKEIAHACQELAPERLGAACLRRHVLGCRLGVQQPLLL